jgi:DNA-binding transcriptional ArsR family regulator
VCQAARRLARAGAAWQDDGMGADLKPTLWRTCRVLSHPGRWRLLAAVLARGQLTVAGAAAASRLRANKASEGLRLLQSRGLLRAERVGSRVWYTPVADPLVEHAGTLLRVLKRAQRGGLAAGELTRAVTAYTHPRRLAIVRALAAAPRHPEALAAACHMSGRAAFRHLGKLNRRGLLVEDAQGRYALKRPDTLLGRVLLRLAADPARRAP